MEAPSRINPPPPPLSNQTSPLKILPPILSSPKYKLLFQVAFIIKTPILKREISYYNKPHWRRFGETFKNKN